MTMGYAKFFFLLGLSLHLVLQLHDVNANAKYASIVVDAESGKVLSRVTLIKNYIRPPLQKSQTLYMAFDALSRGQIRLNERIRISKRAVGMVPSKLGLPAGARLRLRMQLMPL